MGEFLGDILGISGEVHVKNGRSVPHTYTNMREFVWNVIQIDGLLAGGHR